MHTLLKNADTDGFDLLIVDDFVALIVMVWSSKGSI
jgi:hypothetical protein